MGDPMKPYGDVAYADPGYQPDGKSRYPIDTEEHCRAAWSYINQADNAAKYTPDQLARVKAKIRAALKRYGADVSGGDGERAHLVRVGRALLALADEIEATAAVEPAAVAPPSEPDRAEAIQALVRGYGLTPPGTLPARSARSLLAALGGNVRAMADYEDDDYAADPDDDDEMDDDVRDLCAAMEKMTGRKMAMRRGARAWNPELHPRYPKGSPMGGRFRPSVFGIISDLTRWQGGDRSTDPFDRFSDAQLRRVARERGMLGKKGDPDIAKGIKLPHDAPRETVVKALVDDLEGVDLKPDETVSAQTRETLTALASGKKATIPADQVTALMEAIKALKPRPFNFNRLQIAGKGNELTFQRHLRDRPRKTMPQLPTGHDDPTEDGRTLAEFADYLRSRGVSFEYGSMDPRELVASQSQLDGTKVAKIWGFMGGGWKPGGVMIVARVPGTDDDWAVVDGHHRWAAAAARSAGGTPMDVEVMRIDASIDDVLGSEDGARKGIVMDFASFEGFSEDREAPGATKAALPPIPPGGGAALMSTDPDIREAAEREFEKRQAEIDAGEAAFRAEMAAELAADAADAEHEAALEAAFAPSPKKPRAPRKTYDTMSGRPAKVIKPLKPKPRDYVGSQDLDEIASAYRIGQPNTTQAREALAEATYWFGEGGREVGVSARRDVAALLRERAGDLFDDWERERGIQMVDDPLRARELGPGEIRDAVEEDFYRLERLADALLDINDAAERKPRAPRKKKSTELLTTVS